jgi:predicted nuclease of predicted toxin-antitoxin system
VNVLLDENFPLGLVRVLEADGLRVDHIITLGWRGAADARIRQRLAERELIFLTQDDDFLSGSEVAATVVVSRVRQARPIEDRIRVWRSAVKQLADTTHDIRLFELADDGTLVPWSADRHDR